MNFFSLHFDECKWVCVTVSRSYVHTFVSILKSLRWTPQQQAAFKTEAMQYFNEKFGFENPEANPRLMTQLISTNPDAGMRCYVLGGEMVPDEGYSVEDGSWMITVNDTQGKSRVYYIWAVSWQVVVLSYISLNNIKS